MPMLLAVYQRRSFMGRIEVEVSSYIGCMRERGNWPDGLVLWTVSAPADYGKKYLEIIANICQEICSDFILHQCIMS